MDILTVQPSWLVRQQTRAAQRLQSMLVPARPFIEQIERSLALASRFQEPRNILHSSAYMKGSD